MQTVAIEKVGMTMGTLKRRKVREKQRRALFSFSLQEKGKYVLFSKNSVNCDCRSGRLKTGMGSVALVDENGSTHTCPVDNVVLLVARKILDSQTKRYFERFAALTETGELYTQQPDGTYLYAASGMRNAGVVQFAGMDEHFKLALLGEQFCTYLKDDDTFDLYRMDNSCQAGCHYEHRMFLGERPASLYCSAPGTTLDFTESIHDGGFIRFPNAGGEILAMKGFRGRLYVFFEHGIVRLNASGALKNFTADVLSYTGGKIFAKTVCVGQEGIYFMAADGAYRFNGERATRLLPDFVFPPAAETLLESGAVYSGRVFFRYLSEGEYRTLVIHEDDVSGYYMDGIPIFTGEEEGRCLFIDENNTICRFSESGETGRDGIFRSEESDLGYVGRKTLTGLHFEGEGSFTLTVKTGGRTLKRDVVFKDGAADVRISERGERYAFCFELPYATEIASMTAKYTVIR